VEHLQLKELPIAADRLGHVVERHETTPDKALLKGTQVDPVHACALKPQALAVGG
jgi:hypothetical protein